MATALVPVASEQLPTPAATLHPVDGYLARLTSPSSRRSMLGALDRMAELLSGGQATAHDLPWWELRNTHTTALRTALVDAYGPATVNRFLSALRGVLRQSWRQGLMALEDAERASDLPAVKATALPRGRHVDAQEIADLVGTCVADRSPAGARDVALLAVLFTAGLRREEAAALSMDDYDEAHGSLRIRHGKGRRERLVYVKNGAAKALATWLEMRGSQAGPLFCRIHRSGAVRVSESMSGQAIYLRLRERATQAGIAPLSPHDARRTFIGEMLDAGVDIASVQALAGHASVTTTARYDRRPERVKEQAAARLYFPF